MTTRSIMDQLVDVTEKAQLSASELRRSLDEINAHGQASPVIFTEGMLDATGHIDNLDMYLLKLHDALMQWQALGNLLHFATGPTDPPSVIE